MLLGSIAVGWLWGIHTTAMEVSFTGQRVLVDMAKAHQIAADYKITVQNFGFLGHL